MATRNREQRLGLRQVWPTDTSNTSTIDIIAIHGLGTQSPRTWVFKKKDGCEVNWLADPSMLPEAVPEASIFTYDWNANYFEDAPVQTLLGHADSLLAHAKENQSSSKRPIIFVASCFGGLVLAEALTRAAQEGSPYRQVLLSTAGIVFLATPFQGTDARREAQWQVIVGGIMGEETSDRLVHDLDREHDFVLQRVQKFAEVINADSIRLPVHCFYETKKTEILRRVLSAGLAAKLKTRLTNKILVSESSACLQGSPRHGLDATHSGMNKFDGRDSSNFKLVKAALQELARDAPSVISRRTCAAPSHWTVPFGRNHGFVGRHPILTKLLGMIPPGANMDDCQRTALEGLGGVGKTQIALEVAFRLRDQDQHCSIFWVPAVDATSFETAYREIGRKLQVQAIEGDAADVKTLVKVALSDERAGNWLLVVDNVDDPNLFRNEPQAANNATMPLERYLPWSPKGSILFTTRNHKIPVKLDIPKSSIVTIEEMTTAEALDLLRSNAGEELAEDMQSTGTLLELLANLPLAIKQASAYMAKNNISTMSYLEVYQGSDQDQMDLLHEDFQDRHRYENIKNPVATTWLISFSQILADHQLAADFLRYMCFFAEKDVPLSLLPPASKKQALEAIGTLKAYAFLTKREQSDSYDIHRLVQIAVRNWLKVKEELQPWATKALQRVAEAFPSPEHENRNVWIKYLPHAQSVLQFRGAIVDNGEAERDLLSNVSNSFYIQGKYDEAEAMHREALQLREKVLGRDHPDTLTSMNNLAIALESQGKYNEAEAMHREALQLREKVLGRDHPDTLTSMDNLALVLRSQGKYNEAEAMHREALQLSEKVLGRDHPDTLASINNLALVLRIQGKYNEAEAMHRKVLQLREKVLGHDHPDTLASMNNLAVVLESQGKYNEAEAMHREEWRLCEKVLGRDHPDTLTSKNNLALVLRMQGKYDEAEAMHRKVLQLREKVLGRDHPGTLTSMNNLALVLESQGKYNEAEAMHRKVLQLTEKVLGRDHPGTLTSINNLALVLRMQGKYGEAEAMHRQALKLEAM